MFVFFSPLTYRYLREREKKQIHRPTMSKKKDAGKKEEVEADNRIGWVKARVRQTFPHVKNTNFGKQFGLSTYVSTLFLFNFATLGLAGSRFASNWRVHSVGDESSPLFQDTIRLATKKSATIVCCAALLPFADIFLSVFLSLSLFFLICVVQTVRFSYFLSPCCLFVVFLQECHY